MFTPTLYWPMVESSLGVVGACLPLLRPVFTHFPIERVRRSVQEIVSLTSVWRNHGSSSIVQGSEWQKELQNLDSEEVLYSYPKWSPRVIFCERLLCRILGWKPLFTFTLPCFVAHILSEGDSSANVPKHLFRVLLTLPTMEHLSEVQILAWIIASKSDRRCGLCSLLFS